MRVRLLAAGFLLTSALAASAATITMAPPQAKVEPKIAPKTSPKVLPNAPPKAVAKNQAKPACPCDCPDRKKIEQHAKDRPHHQARRARYAAAGYYHYASAAPVIHGPAPVYASQQDEGLRIDDRGWTGGVGYAPEGGGGGGYADDYGQIHFANGGGAENGPTYNSYGQSFQYNPSQAGPFQPRLMGGFAPSR